MSELLTFVIGLLAAETDPSSGCIDRCCFVAVELYLELGSFRKFAGPKTNQVLLDRSSIVPDLSTVLDHSSASAVPVLSTILLLVLLLYQSHQVCSALHVVLQSTLGFRTFGDMPSSIPSSQNYWRLVALKVCRGLCQQPLCTCLERPAHETIPEDTAQPLRD